MGTGSHTQNHTPSAEVPKYVAIPSTNLVEPVVPLPLSVSTATFPGTPTAYLIGDYHFQVVPVTPLLSDFL